MYSCTTKTKPLQPLLQKMRKYWICELYQKSLSMNSPDPFLAIKHHKIYNIIYDHDSNLSMEKGLQNS
jgi:hypothetical protein